MKKILAAALFTLSFGASAMPVFLYPTCSTFNNECTLYNSSGKDVTCNINVRGTTKSGLPVSAFEYRMLYTGMFAWIRVNTPYNDPLNYLQATANCNTTN